MLNFAKKILVILSVFFFFSCSENSATVLEIQDFPAQSLTRKSKKDRQLFTFSNAQKNNISSFIEKNESAALRIQLYCEKIRNIGTPDTSKFEIGFFYDDESTSPLVEGLFADFTGKDFKVAFCFERNGKLPKGFFVKSEEIFSLKKAEIIPAAVGFDYSEEIQEFAFAPNGGRITPKPSNFDFSGVSLVFNSVTSFNSIMPEMELKYSGKIKISVGGEQLTLRASESKKETIPLSALKSPFSQIKIDENENALYSIMVRASDKNLLSFFEGTRFISKPIKVDPGLVIRWKMSNWRGTDYELFEWDRFENVLLFDISNYKIQDDFFRRLAYFVEKAGYRGRILSDSELEGKHGYNAHDYKADDLARFYEKARNENFKLNSKEELLKQILLQSKVIQISPEGKILGGKGAVISICQESPEYLRRQFISHEGWHGIFFIDEEFKNVVASIYYTMDPKTRDYLLKYFQVTPSLNYDVNDEYLMKNEFMAYMLQQPVHSTGEYFIKMASREHSQQMAKKEADYIIETEAAGFVSAATLLDEYVNTRWNLNGGRVWLIN